WIHSFPLHDALAIYHQEDGTQRNGRVRKIERRPVIIFVVHHNEIYYMSEHDTIIDIADGAAEDHGQSERFDLFGRSNPRNPGYQHHTDHYRHDSKKPTLPSAGIT